MRFAKKMTVSPWRKNHDHFRGGKKWNVQPRTVRSYIAKGYIINSQTENNQVILPDIPKPNTKMRPKKETSIDKAILKTLDQRMYISYPILGITQEHFAERLKALEKSNCIFKRDENCNDYSTNLNFILNAEKAAKQYHLHLFGFKFSVFSL